MKAFLLSSSLALLLPALWVQVDVLSILILVGAQHAPHAFPRAKRVRGDGPTVCGDSTGSGDAPALGRGGLCFGILMVTFRAGGPCVWLPACTSLWLVAPACFQKRPHVWHRGCGTQGMVVGPSGMLPGRAGPL